MITYDVRRLGRLVCVKQAPVRTRRVVSVRMGALGPWYHAGTRHAVSLRGSLFGKAEAFEYQVDSPDSGVRVAVGAFEVDLQIVHGGWENIVRKAHPEDSALAAKVTAARPYLWVHLVFAVTTPLLWFTTLLLAFRRFPSPPGPGRHSRAHKTLGWLCTLDITLTAVTGLVFYYVAFMTP